MTTKPKAAPFRLHRRHSTHCTQERPESQVGFSTCQFLGLASLYTNDAAGSLLSRIWGERFSHLAFVLMPAGNCEEGGPEERGHWWNYRHWEARRATQVAVGGEEGWRESQKYRREAAGEGWGLAVQKAWLQLQLPILSACMTLSKTVKSLGRPALVCGMGREN